uniref:BTB domain-containing protein n=1 Tax=Acrobeloides nanus TaxID=290746 RepID=A0A914EMW9_9BILA
MNRRPNIHGQLIAVNVQAAPHNGSNSEESKMSKRLTLKRLKREEEKSKVGNPDRKVQKKKIWNNFTQPGVIGRLNSLFLHESMSDVVFTVKTAQESENMPAHSVILSMASDVFFKNFMDEKFNKNRGDDGRQHITITDIEPKIFRRLLYFIYTDKIKLNPESAFQMIDAAKKYNVHGLIRRCLNQFIVGLNARKYDPTYVFGILNMASCHHFEDLHDQALSAIEWHEEMIEHEDFFILDKDVFQKVVQNLWKFTSNPQRIFTRMIDFAHHKLAEANKSTDIWDVREYLKDTVSSLDVCKFNSKKDRLFMADSGILNDGKAMELRYGLNA